MSLCMNNLEGGLVMSESDNIHSCHYATQELSQKETEDPGPRSLGFATCDVNYRLRLLA